MATKEKVLRDTARDKYYNLIKNALIEMGEDALEVATNKIAFPIVDSEGNELSVLVTVSIPTGARGGEGYDCYAEAEGYAVEKAEKEAKAKAKAEKVAKAQAKAKAKAEKESA